MLSESSPLTAQDLKLRLCFILTREIANILCRTAVKQVLNGTISDKGILAPLNSKINNPLMKELKEKYGYILCQSLGSSYANTASVSSVRRRLSLRVRDRPYHRA